MNGKRKLSVGNTQLGLWDTGSVAADFLKRSICKCLASRSGRFIRRNGALGAHWIVGLMDPGAGLDPVVAMTNVSAPAGFRILVIQPVATKHTDLAAPTSFPTQK